MAVPTARATDREQGFTMIELVVVVLVIGVLATLAIPSFLGLGDRGHVAAARADARAMAKLAAAQHEASPVTTVAGLEAVGFRRSPQLAHAICVDPDGRTHATAAMHADGDSAWVVDFEGRLTEATATDVTAALVSLARCPGVGAVDAVAAG